MITIHFEFYKISSYLSIRRHKAKYGSKFRRVKLCIKNDGSDHEVSLWILYNKISSYFIDFCLNSVDLFCGFVLYDFDDE